MDEELDIKGMKAEEALMDLIYSRREALAELAIERQHNRELRDQAREMRRQLTAHGGKVKTLTEENEELSQKLEEEVLWAEHFRVLCESLKAALDKPIPTRPPPPDPGAPVKNDEPSAKNFLSMSEVVSALLRDKNRRPPRP